jgi:hypothetical protein
LARFRAASRDAGPEKIAPERMTMLRIPFARAALGAALLVVLASPPSSTAPSASDNLLPNGDMETPLEGHPWMPAGWDTSVSGMPSVFFGRDSFLVHGGRYAINVANASMLFHMGHNWNQALRITPDMWNKDAVLSVWSRSNGVEGRGYVLMQAYRDTISRMALDWKVDRETARARMRINRVDDPLIDLGWQRVVFTENETDWVRRDLRVFIPPSTNVLFVRCGVMGTGQVLFDDAELTIEPAAPAPELPLMTNLLADPGFEGDGGAWELAIPPFEDMHVGLVGESPRTGKQCLGMWGGMTSLVQARAGACQVFSNRNLAGKRIRLTSHVRTDSLRGLAYIKVYAHTLGGVEHPPTPQQFSTNTDWTATSMEMDVPPDTYSLWVWSLYNAPAPGKVYFDDMELVVLGPATGQP